jgi:hypothetical protein
MTPVGRVRRSLLRGADFVALLLDRGIRQEDRRRRGKGRQGLRRLLVVAVIEAAASVLPSSVIIG